jgi:hypothetical protein
MAKPHTELSRALVIMIGAFSALVMMALAANAVLVLGAALGPRTGPNALPGMILPASAVLAIIVVPGLCQGLFMGYLCHEREVCLATVASLITACVGVVLGSVTLREIRFGPEIGLPLMRLAMLGMLVLFGLLFVLAAALGAHITAKSRHRRDNRGELPE